MAKDKGSETGIDLIDDNNGEDYSFRRVSFPPATVIFEEGDITASAFLIVKGKVEIRKGMRGKHPRVLGMVGRGEVIGEMALFDGKAHIASAVAVGTVVATEISATEFNRRVQAMDPVVRSAVKLMSKRARQLADMLMEEPADVDWYNWKRS